MKIQCDVCNNDEATVYCSADEAALCDACDHRVHHANKLAGKHLRFSLIRPSSNQDSPLCDVCQEKKAYLFCQQDRAILCVDCDYRIHKANEHTQKHNRFLLTGVKLSATTTLYSPATTLAEKPTTQNLPTAAVKVVDGGSNNASSISEYLMETLPGWGVEDFLDICPAPSIESSKSTNDSDFPPAIWDVSDLGSFSSHENVGIWVPQAPPPPLSSSSSRYPSSANIDFGNQMVFKEAKNGASIKRSNRDWEGDDGCFIVPQISPSSSVASKRSRTLVESSFRSRDLRTLWFHY